MIKKINKIFNTVNNMSFPIAILLAAVMISVSIFITGWVFLGKIQSNLNVNRTNPTNIRTPEQIKQMQIDAQKQRQEQQQQLLQLQQEQQKLLQDQQKPEQE